MVVSEWVGRKKTLTGRGSTTRRFKDLGDPEDGKVVEGAAPMAGRGSRAVQTATSGVRKVLVKEGA